MARWIEPSERMAVIAKAAAGPLPATGIIGVADIVWLPIGDDWFAISSETAGWVVLDEAERADLASWTSGVDVRDLTGRASRLLATTLWSRALITVGGRTALAPVDWDAVIASTRDDYGLVVVLNSGCNLACTYCYLGHSAPTPEHDLGLDLARGAIDAAMGRAEQNVIIDFGEISAALDHFFVLADYARGRARALGRALRIAVQTNATTLTDAVVERLVGLDVILGVSIDGPAELHDLARPRRGGRPTHSLVLRGLERCRAASLPYHLIVTVGRHNVDHPDAVLDQVGELAPDTFLCKPILAHGEARRDWDRLGASPGEIAAFLERSISRASVIGLGALDQSAAKFLLRLVGDRRGWRDSCTSRHCASGRSLHVLSARGELHACPRFVEPGLGRAVTATTVDLELTAAPLLAASLRVEPASCRGCPWLRTCGGGCTLSGQHDDRGVDPLPDRHCTSYDTQHRSLVTYVLPALMRGEIPFDKALAGARLVSDAPD